MITFHENQMAQGSIFRVSACIKSAPDLIASVDYEAEQYQGFEKAKADAVEALRQHVIKIAHDCERAFFALANYTDKNRLAKIEREIKTGGREAPDTEKEP